MPKLFARLLKDESGATAIEYGLIAALIAVALITGAGAVGTRPEHAVQCDFDQAECDLTNVATART